MILERLANAALCATPHAGVVRGLDWLRGLDTVPPDGRIELGDGLYVNVDSYLTAAPSARRFESHRRYVDIQYVAAGEERIFVAPAGSLPVIEPYDPGRDVAFYRDPDAASVLVLRAGDFAVFFPDDAHKPGCEAVDGSGGTRVRKLVVKVPVE